MVSFHNIQIEQFWKSSTIHCTPEQFRQFLVDSGFSLSEDEVQQILSDLENEQQRITIESLCKKVPAWHSNQYAMLEFIREKALKLAQESKRKFSAQKKLKPQSASATRQRETNARPISNISSKTK